MSRPASRHAATALPTRAFGRLAAGYNRGIGDATCPPNKSSASQMDVFIYFYERLPVGLDELEDALDEALEGVGDVTGSGTGASGSNLDLRISDENVSKDQVLELIQTALRRFDLAHASRIVIDGQRFSIQ
jgi:hypothetical protein